MLTLLLLLLLLLLEHIRASLMVCFLIPFWRPRRKHDHDEQVRGGHDEEKLQRVSHAEGAGGKGLAQGHEEVHRRAEPPQGHGKGEAAR